MRRATRRLRRAHEIAGARLRLDQRLAFEHAITLGGGREAHAVTLHEGAHRRHALAGAQHAIANRAAIVRGQLAVKRFARGGIVRGRRECMRREGHAGVRVHGLLCLRSG